MSMTADEALTPAALEWLAAEMAINGVCPAPFPTVVTPSCCPYKGTGSTVGCNYLANAANCWVQAALQEAAHRAARASAATQTAETASARVRTAFAVLAEVERQVIEFKRSTLDGDELLAQAYGWRGYADGDPIEFATTARAATSPPVQAAETVAEEE